MKYTKIIQDTFIILNNIKNENISHISSGLYFDEIYVEARKQLGDYIMSLPNDVKENVSINSESFFHTFCMTTLMITLEVSIETDPANPYSREVQIFDEINHNVVDVTINDYSLDDLILQERFSRHTMNRIKKAVKECYELRGSEDLTVNGRFTSTKEDFYKVDFISEEFNLSVDSYKHDVNDQLDDDDRLESSYDDLEDDEESDVNIRWQNALNAIYMETSTMMIQDFITKYKIEIGLGLIFDDIYKEFIEKFRLIEEKYHPSDRKSKEKPIDIFIYFCEHVFHIDVCALKYNEFTGFHKKLCANKGNAIVLDNHIFKVAGTDEMNYGSLSVDEVLQHAHIVNMFDCQELYNSVRTIYNLRQNI